MKKAILNVLAGLALVSFSLASQAKGIQVTPEAPYNGAKLQDGDSYVEFITGEIVSVDSQYVPACPSLPEDNGQPICLGFTSQTVINVKFDLGGCLDSLGPVAITQISNDSYETSALVVSALRVANKRSLTAFCIAIPTQFVQFTLTGHDFTKEQVESMIRFSGK